MGGDDNVMKRFVDSWYFVLLLLIVAILMGTTLFFVLDVPNAY